MKRRVSLLRAGRVSAVAAVTALVLSGCSRTYFLPEDSEGTTSHTNEILALWKETWAVSLAIGILVWGLIIWAVVAYRRRSNDSGFPAQVQYHIPLEILYTVVPLMIVAVLFVMTVRVQNKVGESDPDKVPVDVNITVVAKRWSWDFNYTDAKVYDSGVQAELTGKDGVEKTLPTLYLPQGKSVRLTIESRDVIHSVWIPSFLDKMDAIPGKPNYRVYKPLRLGTFQGKCSELCGEYHSAMLFNVVVVTPADYDKHLAELKSAGKTGVSEPGGLPQGLQVSHAVAGPANASEPHQPPVHLTAKGAGAA